METVSNSDYSTLLVGNYQQATIQQIPQNISHPYPINAYSQSPPAANPADYYPLFSSLSTYYTSSYSSLSPHAVSSPTSLSYPNTHSASSSSLEISLNDDVIDEISTSMQVTDHDEYDYDCGYEENSVLAEATLWKDVLSYYLGDGPDDLVASLAITTLPCAAAASFASSAL